VQVDALDDGKITEVSSRNSYRIDIDNARRPEQASTGSIHP
jgi:hypothetical protein